MHVRNVQSPLPVKPKLTLEVLLTMVVISRSHLTGQLSAKDSQSHKWHSIHKSRYSWGSIPRVYSKISSEYYPLKFLFLQFLKWKDKYQWHIMIAKLPGLWFLDSWWFPPYVLCKPLDIIFVFDNAIFRHFIAIGYYCMDHDLVFLAHGLRGLNGRLDIEKRAYQSSDTFLDPFLYVG